MKLTIIGGIGLLAVPLVAAHGADAGSMLTLMESIVVVLSVFLVAVTWAAMRHKDPYYFLRLACIAWALSLMMHLAFSLYSVFPKESADYGVQVMVMAALILFILGMKK